MFAFAWKYISNMCENVNQVKHKSFKVILYSYLILKKMNERITDS